MPLEILLVEDEKVTLDQLVEEITVFLSDRGVIANVHKAGTFDVAMDILRDSSRRLDVVVTDTYEGNYIDRRAEALKIVDLMRGTRYTPIILYSSSPPPEGFSESPFVRWADKTVAGAVAQALGFVLDTGVPEVASALNEQINCIGSKFLWDFLDHNWAQLNGFPKAVLDRLMRRRLATAISNVTSDGAIAVIQEVDGVEYYQYPPLDISSYRMGQIIRKLTNADDIRVLLTPHCHLKTQQNQATPRAEFVLTAPLRRASDVVGTKFQDIGAEHSVETRHKKIGNLIKVPSQSIVGKPEGRFWFFPAFLEIPHAYADLMKLEALPFDTLRDQYASLAALTEPFAESLQSCFLRYYGGVGVPDIRPGSIEDITQ
jgi:hypothetical protein